MEDEIKFAVTSKRLSLYKAFKEEVEKLGWKYNEKFNPFTEKKSKIFNCMFFSSDWDGEGAKFSFSNYGSKTKVINLDGEFEEALKYAESLVKKKITYEDVKKVFEDSSYGLGFFVANSRIGEKIEALNKLINVAEYLNPEHVRADVSLALDADRIILVHVTTNFGQPMFINESRAKIAITILGEETIKTALK